MEDVLRWNMCKYWEYVDWLIPDDQKKWITDEEAQRQITNCNNQLLAFQVAQATKKN